MIIVNIAGKNKLWKIFVFSVDISNDYLEEIEMYGLDKIAETDGRTNERRDLLNLKIFNQKSRTFLIYKFKTLLNTVDQIKTVSI